MPVSVGVVVSTVQRDGSTWASVRVLTGDGAQGAYEAPWDTFFNVEHSVILRMPDGTAGAMTTKTKKKRSAKQERKRIEGVGGRAHVGSGAFVGHKSDGSTDRWRMENKFTTAQSFRVTLNDLTKIRSECRNAQAPVFNIDFQDKRTGATKDSWVLVPHKDWERLEKQAIKNTATPPGL